MSLTIEVDASAQELQTWDPRVGGAECPTVVKTSAALELGGPAPL